MDIEMKTSRQAEERTFAVNLMRDWVVPTFVLDQDSKVMIWNHACERLAGVLSSELVGTSNHHQG
jgi:PAS domain-containing protein